MILTSDRTLAKARYCDQVYFVESNGKEEQLQEVLGRFAITVSPDELLSRCGACNGEFIPR